MPKGTVAPEKIYATLPSTKRGERVYLTGDPKGKYFGYGRTKHLVMRDIENPLECYTYDDHACNLTSARFAPSGFYVASADEKGLVKIWDTTQPDHKVKYEYQVMGSPISDLAWTEDSKRLVLVGAANPPGRAILWDSGSSCGTFEGGHTKAINSCDIKQQRPYRCCTGSEDFENGFYTAVPFKLDHMNRESEGKYVNACRYAADGSVYVTVTSGGKAFIYDGKDGSFKGELNGGAESAHSAGIYGLSFGADSTKCITSSADKTVKMWDVANNALLHTFTFPDDLGYQQLGCLWQGDNILSVGLNGFISYLDTEAPAAPKKVIKGHASNVMALAVDAAGSYFAGGVDGRVSRSSLESGETELFENAHTSQVVEMAVQGDTLVTVSVDDTITFTAKDGGALENSTKLESQPRGVCASAGDLVAVAMCNHVSLFKGGKCVFTVPNAGGFEGLSCAIKADGSEVAVGGSDSKIHIFTVDGETLVAKQQVASATPVHALDYSGDGASLAAGEKSRQVMIYDASSYEKTQVRWKRHTATVNAVKWSPDSQHLLSGSLDTNLFIWSVAKPMGQIEVKAAHPTANVNAVAWTSDNTFVTAGNDGCVRSWSLTPST